MRSEKWSEDGRGSAVWAEDGGGDSDEMRAANRTTRWRGWTAHSTRLRQSGDSDVCKESRPEGGGEARAAVYSSMTAAPPSTCCREGCR